MRDVTPKMRARVCRGLVRLVNGVPPWAGLTRQTPNNNNLHLPTGLLWRLGKGPNKCQLVTCEVGAGSMPVAKALVPALGLGSAEPGGTRVLVRGRRTRDLLKRLVDPSPAGRSHRWGVCFCIGRHDRSGLKLGRDSQGEKVGGWTCFSSTAARPGFRKNVVLVVLIETSRKIGEHPVIGLMLYLTCGSSLCCWMLTRRPLATFYF